MTTALEDAGERITTALGPLWRGELTARSLSRALGGAPLADVWAACTDPQPLVRLVGGHASHAQLARAALACAHIAAEGGPPTVVGAVAELAPYVARVEDLREIAVRDELSGIEDGLRAAARDDARDAHRIDAALSLVHLVRDDRENEAWNAAALVAHHASAACPDRRATMAAAVREHLPCPPVETLLGPDPGWGKRGAKRRSGRTRMKRGK